nr:ATPase [Gammaproteobacteria bacterium]NIQ11413.1 ATPase [Gammaproteobacteria bacterium]NIR25944.1 ATPase [Gammaproteobacteria bacterium]NIY20354.1 ATPase [Gammaproteobacteria bacterium]
MNRDVASAMISDDCWHTLDNSTTLKRLGSSLQGLTIEEATSRLEHYGRNSLPIKPPPGLGRIFLHQFLSPLIYILIVAGIVSMAVGEWTDAGFIFAVILLNSILGTFQEWKAEHSAAALQKLMKIRCRVRRADEIHEVDAEELVPGDIILLESGDRIPADV